MEDWTDESDFDRGYRDGYNGRHVDYHTETPEYRLGYAAGNKQLLLDIINRDERREA